MSKKNEDNMDSNQLIQEQNDRMCQLIIKLQTESMILDLKKSVLCFGLYLPPEQLLCRNFSMLSVEDVVDCLNLLQDVKDIVDDPFSLIDKVKKGGGDDDLDLSFKQPREVWREMPLFNSQTLMFLKMKDCPGFSEILIYHKNYLERLKEQLKPIIENGPNTANEHFVLGADFSVQSKIPITVKPVVLPKVYVFLEEEGCLAKGEEMKFLSIFGDVLRVERGVKLVWLSINKKNNNPNWVRLRALFQELGVDMDKANNYEFVARYFVGANGKTPDLKPRGRDTGDDLNSFIERLRQVIEMH